MLGRDDLVLCAGTLLESSLRERAHAAQAAGFAGVSLWLSDVFRARAEGMSDADIRALLDDHGLEIGELDCLTSWLPGSGPPENAPFEVDDAIRASDDDFFAVADSIGGRSLNIAEIWGSNIELDAAVEAFARVCDRAADHGLLVHLEFLPWSAFPNLNAAWDVVRLADRPNGGLIVDSWHCARSATTLEDLAAIPGERVTAIQLSDATPEPAHEVITDETMHFRLLPGEGAAHVVEIVQTLDKIGCTAPIGIEVFSDELSAMEPDVAAQKAADATRRVLAAAR
ncbi:MAG: sugar phosphate isomerase/epimerase [Acidimicrobiia bacterium]